MNTCRLRGKMAENGMNQKSLAKAIGMSENSLSRKLSRKRDFRLEEMVKICEILNITDPTDIFFDIDIPITQRTNYPRRLSYKNLKKED